MSAMTTYIACPAPVYEGCEEPAFVNDKELLTKRLSEKPILRNLASNLFNIFNDTLEEFLDDAIEEFLDDAIPQHIDNHDDVVSMWMQHFQDYANPDKEKTVDTLFSRNTILDITKGILLDAAKEVFVWDKHTEKENNITQYLNVNSEISTLAVKHDDVTIITMITGWDSYGDAPNEIFTPLALIETSGAFEKSFPHPSTKE